MAYTMIQVSGLVPSKIRATKTSPNIYEFEVEANETGILAVAGNITSVGPAISGANPVTLKVYSSFTGGDTWELITPKDEISVSVPGWVTWKRSQSSNEIIGSRVRVVIEPASVDGDAWADVTNVFRTNLDATDSVFSPTAIEIGAITATTGYVRDGASQEVILSTTDAALNRPLPVTILNTLTGQPVNLEGGLPYSADTQEFSYPDDVTELIRFKKAGATVKTVTITYADSSKEQLTSIVYT